MNQKSGGGGPVPPCPPPPPPCSSTYATMKYQKGCCLFHICAGIFSLPGADLLEMKVYLDHLQRKQLASLISLDS